MSDLKHKDSSTIRNNLYNKFLIKHKELKSALKYEWRPSQLLNYNESFVLAILYFPDLIHNCWIAELVLAAFNKQGIYIIRISTCLICVPTFRDFLSIRSNVKFYVNRHFQKNLTFKTFLFDEQSRDFTNLSCPMLFWHWTYSVLGALMGK